MLYVLRLLFTKWAIFSFHMILWKFSKDAIIYLFTWFYVFIWLSITGCTFVQSAWYNLNFRAFCQSVIEFVTKFSIGQKKWSRRPGNYFLSEWDVWQTETRALNHQVGAAPHNSCEDSTEILLLANYLKLLEMPQCHKEGDVEPVIPFQLPSNKFTTMDISLETKKRVAWPCNTLEPVALLQLAVLNGSRNVALLSSTKLYEQKYSAYLIQCLCITEWEEEK